MPRTVMVLTPVVSETAIDHIVPVVTDPRPPVRAFVQLRAPATAGLFVPSTQMYSVPAETVWLVVVISTTGASAGASPKNDIASAISVSRAVAEKMESKGKPSVTRRHPLLYASPATWVPPDDAPYTSAVTEAGAPCAMNRSGYDAL